MSRILRHKNLATKFQILVEIAAGQPNITQKDMAERLGITPQAVSDYVGELKDEHWVVSEGRSKYRLTNEAVNWILSMTAELHSYLEFVGKAITRVTTCTAVAACDLTQGQTVRLYMEDGLLFAGSTTPQDEAGTTGTAASDAGQGQDVGVSNLSGVMDLQPGTVKIHRVPNVRRGGSSTVDAARLREAASRHPFLGAIGIEALAALRRAGLEPGSFYGVTEAVVEAARSGLSSTVACVDDELPRLLSRLAEEGIEYRLADSSAAQ